MLLIDFLSGIIIGALSGMGIGGGGLLVIYLRLIRGYSQIDAQGANLLFFLFAAASSLIFHIKKRKMDFRLIGIFVVSGIVGSLLSTSFVSSIPEDITGKFFGGMLVISGVWTLFSTYRKKRKKAD